MQGRLTPRALAAARLDIAHGQKFDRSKYETVRELPRLNAWIARARDLGYVAIDTETTSLDPMQAELCGFSLALAPNEACYVPVSHRQGGDGNGGLFQGESRPRSNFRTRRARRHQAVCLKTKACSRSART